MTMLRRRRILPRLTAAPADADSDDDSSSLSDDDDAEAEEEAAKAEPAAPADADSDDDSERLMRESVAALGAAIQEGDEALVASLLAKGVDIEASGLVSPQDGTLVSPLMFAAFNNRKSCAALLLRAGAKQDRTFGTSQITPLLVCVSRGNVETAKVLIDAGADLGQADAHGRSPLFISCLMNHPGCSALLLDAGADVEQAMTSINPGATALYGAVQGNRCDCCSFHCASLLLEAGAIVDARTVQGATPMMVACQHGRHGLAMLLSSYGASALPRSLRGQPPKDLVASGPRRRERARRVGHVARRVGRLYATPPHRGAGTVPHARTASRGCVLARRWLAQPRCACEELPQTACERRGRQDDCPRQ